MKTTELFKTKAVLSFEVFPPKPTSPIDTIYKTLDGMKDLKPDFISVTYGAAGSGSCNHTFEIASDICRHFGIEGIAHLSCKGLGRADIAKKLISQLFLDNDCFYSFLERCQIAGIQVPIEAGIMPVVNKKQIEKMTALCGATIPKKFAKMLERYGDDPIAMRDAGIAYAVNQIVDLITQGVDGIHLYTMNNQYREIKLCVLLS